MSGTSPARLRVGVFGDTASGKTTLLSSFFGSQQRYDTDKHLGYRLTAVDVNDGNLLLRNYYGMQEGRFPQATVSRARAYEFNLKVLGLVQPAMRIEWIDYPGGWWSGAEPSDPGEQQERQRCILNLLDADVCLLLVDGRLFQNEASRPEYLRGLFQRYQAEIDRWFRVAGQINRPPRAALKDWVITLTKADLQGPGYRADRFCREIITKAQEQQSWLVETLKRHSPTDSSEYAISRFGTRYMLLSAALAQGPRVINADETIGLDLLIPATFQTALLRFADQQLNDSQLSNLSLWDRLLLALKQMADRNLLTRNVAPQNSGLAMLAQFLVGLASIPAQQRVSEYQRQRQHAVDEGNALKAFAHSLDKALDSDHARRIFHVNQYS